MQLDLNIGSVGKCPFFIYIKKTLNHYTRKEVHQIEM